MYFIFFKINKLLNIMVRKKIYRKRITLSSKSKFTGKLNTIVNCERILWFFDLKELGVEIK